MYMQKIPYARKALLCQAIGVALAWQAHPARARDLAQNENVTIFASTALQTWLAPGGNALTLQDGARTLSIQMYTSTLTSSTADIRSEVASASDTALLVMNGSTATIQGGTITSLYGKGLQAIGAAGDGSDRPALVSLSGTTVAGAVAGVGVGNGSTVTASNASIRGIGASGVGVQVSSGTAELTAGTVATGTINGASLIGDPRGGSVGDTGRMLIVDNATVEGESGAAVRLAAAIPGASAGQVIVRNGGQLKGGNGIAIDVGSTMKADIDVSTTTIVGDIIARGSGSANMALGDRAGIIGGMNGDITAAIDDTAAWQMTKDSSITSLRLDGAVSFDTVPGSFRTLDVTRDLSGMGGQIGLNVTLNAGGPLADQATDRLLIHGSVTTTGPTRLSIMPTGDGALTDANHNGTVDNNEGISIVQVAGDSRHDAFALAGGYVAAGPWQYTLHAFGPGQIDASQNQLGAGSAFQWDYRLGNRYVDDCGDDCHPVDPPVDPPVVPPVDPVDPVRPEPVDRPAVVPQLPAYMLAPMALQNYGNALNDGLHQRLGEIRDSAYGANAGGEVFARAISSQLNYTRNLSFQRYGYDFDQQINALQVGAGIVAVDTDQGSIRAGWALDSGTTRVTPSAADGNSRAKYYANGGAAWVTYQHGSGLWVDGVLGVARYHGDVSTELRGDEVGKLHAQGWTMSIEVGKPLPLGGDWTVEPQFQFRVQQLNFRDFRDKDGLDVRLGNSVQTTSRLGIQIGRTANPVLAPYGRLDLIHTSNGNPSLQASSEAWGTGDSFQTGNTGNAYRVAAGVSSQLTDHVQLYGEGTWRHYVGSYGLKGWSANAGIRVTF